VLNEHKVDTASGAAKSDTKKKRKPLRVDKNWAQYRWLVTPERAVKMWLKQSFSVPEARGYRELYADYEVPSKPQFREKTHDRVTKADIARLLEAAMAGSNVKVKRGARTLGDRGIVAVPAGLHAMNPNYRDAGERM